MAWTLGRAGHNHISKHTLNSSYHKLHHLAHPLTPLLWFIADAQHLREMMDKQASLEQRLKLKDKEIKDLKRKVADLGEPMSYVEAELPRRAVMAASHALGVLKNQHPGLDMQVLSKGYACTPAEAQALADQARPIS
jgi:hypothetical protein